MPGGSGFILIVIAVVAVAIVVLVLGIAAARKRREDLAKLAAGLGWSFDPGYDSTHDDRFGHFEVFCRGHSRCAFNTLQGPLTIQDRPYQCRCGDYEYKVTTSNGKTTTTRTYRFSYMILLLPFAGTPDLIIRREGLWDKLKGFLGFEDINFESEEFSRKFYVKGPDKKFAYDVVHPRMMEFLLASPPIGVDIEQGECCMTDGRRRWEPSEFADTLRWAQQFFALWPGHVLDDLAARQSGAMRT